MSALYKVLGSDGSSCHGGTGRWHLPNGKPGKWMPRLADIEPCERGYHLCREDDLLFWLGPRIFVAEGRGRRVEADDKIVVAQARLLAETRWDERAIRHFAADCAERVIPLYREWKPDADEPWMDMDAARDESLGDAERAARAARAAGAARAAEAARAARAAGAARASWAARAARAAGAARAARAAEREWQTARLFEYVRGER